MVFASVNKMGTQHFNENSKIFLLSIYLVMILSSLLLLFVTFEKTLLFDFKQDRKSLESKSKRPNQVANPPKILLVNPNRVIENKLKDKKGETTK
jgi:hypothetical protein